MEYPTGIDVALARTTAGSVVLPHGRTPAPLRLSALAPQWSDFLGQVRHAHCAPPPHGRPIAGLSLVRVVLALIFGIPSIRVARKSGHDGLVSHRSAVHAIPICGDKDVPGRSRSCSFDQRRRPETLRTAIATAFLCPTSTTSFLPRVTPV